MKKVFSCLLAVLMVASMLIVSVGAKVGPEYYDYGDIANVSRKAIRLDGEREDAYDAAEAIEIATLQNPSKVSDVTGTAWWVYDTEYIWVFVEVNDTTLVTKAPGPLESSFKEDSVEMIIDWDNSATNEADVAPYQVRVTHEGYISARLGQKGVSMFGSKLDGGKAPVNWLEGFGKHKEDGSGYVVEFKIAIPDDKYEIGEHISIMMMINDYDETAATTGTSSRVMIVSGPNPDANQWAVANAGYIGFDYAPYTADMTIIYVAIAMVAALAIGGVALISLKKKAK